ncbi:MAG TPA: TonB-dependent receptor [Candidatus Acidoferrales bacterium]|nr:TonB-dependent receptor [Candidatus Acidoferrales bacterium]
MSRSAVKFRSLFVLVISSVVFTCSVAFSQVLRGKVVDEDSVTIVSAEVSIPMLQLTTVTDDNGEFIFKNVPRGSYRIDARRIGFDVAPVELAVSSDSTFIQIVMHGKLMVLHDVTVTAGPRPSDIANSSQSVSVVQGSKLLENIGSSVGSELEDLPGVSVVHSGEFSEKPVIRGLGYQRVEVLEDGERYEYQGWDDDDSPGIDALSLKRIEVVRGPNSVLYGSDALGGVVNFIHDDGNLGSKDTNALLGKFELNGFSNNNEGAAHLGLNGATSLAQYYADITLKDAGNVNTPKGVLPNTGASEVDFEGAVSTRRTFGNFLLGYSRFDQNREILPVGEDSGSLPYQHTIHDRIRLSYASERDPLQVSFEGVYQQNDAAEYQNKDIASLLDRLRLQSFSLDTKVSYDISDNDYATAGISASDEQNSTLGPEPIIPDYRQSTVAAFLFNNYRAQSIDASAGARYDYRTLKTADNAILNLFGQTRVVQAVTGSIGMLWHVSSAVSFGADVGSGWRAPNVEELFITGVQEGSFMYKLGNPNLAPEQSFSTDCVVRVDGSLADGEVSAYYDRINRYIFPGPTGEIDSASGFMKYTERQANATLSGVDGQLSVKVTKRATLTIGGDFMLARNDNAGTWLPLTPANRLTSEVRYDFSDLSFFREAYCSIGANFVFDQDHFDPLETRTPGYALFNLGFGGTLKIFDHGMDIYCKLDNLLDRAYHDNMSLYKLYAFEPGFNFSVTINVPFVIIR